MLPLRHGVLSLSDTYWVCVQTHYVLPTCISTQSIEAAYSSGYAMVLQMICVADANHQHEHTANQLYG